MAGEFATRPRTLFGKLSYIEEQAVLSKATGDVTRGLYFTIPKEFEILDLPFDAKLSAEIAAEVAAHGKVRPEKRREWAVNYLCRAKAKLEEIF
jgi:hypothetical protein